MDSPRSFRVNALTKHPLRYNASVSIEALSRPNGLLLHAVDASHGRRDGDLRHGLEAT